jgi:peroxiredoxin
MAMVPEVTWKFRDGGAWKDVNSIELFRNKRVLIFSLPGAFTPTCSVFQLPAYEEAYDEIREQMIDEVYCLSVNDGFVMNAWFDEQNIKKVKSIPDGNGEFTHAMGMSVSKSNLGFGFRSWRYAMIVDQCEIEMTFVEEGKIGNCYQDPYMVSDPQTVLKYLRSK